MSGSCSLAVGEIMVFPFWIYMANKTIKTIRDETSVHLQNTVLDILDLVREFSVPQL